MSTSIYLQFPPVRGEIVFAAIRGITVEDAHEAFQVVLAYRNALPGWDGDGYEASTSWQRLQDWLRTDPDALACHEFLRSGFSLGNIEPRTAAYLESLGLDVDYGALRKSDSYDSVKGILEGQAPMRMSVNSLMEEIDGLSWG